MSPIGGALDDAAITCRHAMLAADIDFMPDAMLMF